MSYTKRNRWDQVDDHEGHLNYTLPIGGVWASLTLANGLAGGTGPNQRIGRSIKMIWAKLRITSSTSNRVALVYDRQARGAAPTVVGSDDSIFRVSGASNLLRTANPWTSKRFVILFDYCFNSPGSAASSEEFHIPIGLDATYNTGVTGTITDINTGSLYLVQITDGAGSTDYANVVVAYED